MGRKKNLDKKTTEQIVSEALVKEEAAFRASRKSNFQAPSENEISVREQFRAFWALNKKNYKKNKDLEEILWCHLKASGYDKPELFAEGIEHFGLSK